MAGSGPSDAQGELRPARRLRRLLRAAPSGLDQLAQWAGLPVELKDVSAALAGMLALPRLGPWGAAGFGLLVLTLAGFGAVVFARAPDRPAMLTSVAAQALLGSIAAFAFALLNGEARTLHPLVRFGVGLYTLWYLMLPPILTLPRVAALLPVWAVLTVEALRLRSERASPLWLVPWALVAARLSPKVASDLWVSVGLWTAAYAALGVLMYRRAGGLRVPERGLLFGSMAAAYAGGMARDPSRFAEALQGGYSALFTFLGLFWMWLAADLVDDAWEVAQRVAGRLQRLLGRRRAPYVVGSVLAALGLVGLLLALAPQVIVSPLPVPLLRAVGGFLRSAWGDGLTVCGSLLLLVGLASAWRALRGHDPREAATDGLASGITLALVYWGGSQAWNAIAEVETPSGWWPLVLASVPVLLEEAKQVSRGTRAGSGALAVAAVALLGISTTAFQFAANPTAAVRNTTLYPLLGMVLWGLPHLLARVVVGWSAEVPSVRLFFAGYFCALPAALLAPSLREGAPALAVLFWPAALRLVGVSLEGPWHARAASLLLVASGTLAFYYQPLFLPVPFVPWTEALLQRLGQVQATELLSLAQILAWAGAGVAAGLAAAGRGRLRWVAAAVAWLAWNRLVL